MGISSNTEVAVAKLTLGQERRRRPRFPCKGPAEVEALDSHSRYQGEIKDLSLTGCYILAPVELDLMPHADVELRLSVNGDQLNAPARVILVRPESGVAFEFLPTDPEMRSALLTLIQKLTAGLSSQEDDSAG